MKVLVASDGGTNVESIAEAAARMSGPDGSIDVLTVIEVPRTLLDELRRVYDAPTPGPMGIDGEYVSPPAVAAGTTSNWPGDDAFIERYVADQADRRLREFVAAIESRERAATIKTVESENPAQAILAEIELGGYDCVLIGSHGQGRFDGLLGSVGTKVVRRSPVTVVVCR